ncbi:MAG: hypothetical protein NAG76_02100 [Candidatus Pristimantibacillus lignocellulolyticus]|uniref:Uncharacterized protein n=1 Tax=Candidatus Pristimantibacillus lignocellulolyticus TaxID=2994561 RepID=A0A9J6ZH70_9BACL|nr:MAG: hypothetical protein NAG76_02100 [Candidatus Pristimantibacillus lignocellulolyticus]
MKVLLMSLVILIVCIVSAWYWLKRKQTASNDNSDEQRTISETYQSPDQDWFHINGKKDSFIISKNEDHEFLVENGRIVASRNRSKSQQFIYYKGE